MVPKGRHLQRAVARVQYKRMLLATASWLALLWKLWQLFVIYLKSTGRS
jgi:hypothetical protein